MKFVTTTLKTKRGLPYNSRSTKNANGWSKQVAGNLKHRYLRLAVVGTFDSLARMCRFDIIKITVKHPTDFGYYKDVYILKKNKAKFLDRILK